MFGLGLGPSLIIGVIACAEFLRVSPVVTMPIAAALMCIGTYAVSRERRVIDVGIASAGALATKVIALSLRQPIDAIALPAVFQPLIRFCCSDGFVIGVCAVSMLSCAFVGIFGPLRCLPKVEPRQHTNGH
ncbi:hypothetical protein SAMN03159335_06210 [Burkholderia cepacia]|nr:hypothetical protein SAMN03159335_06210 [Burkholderia cepacia]